MGDIHFLFQAIRRMCDQRDKLKERCAEKLAELDGMYEREAELEGLIDQAGIDLQWAIFLDYCNTSCWRYKCQD